jgi:hypothetical protein
MENYCLMMRRNSACETITIAVAGVPWVAGEEYDVAVEDFLEASVTLEVGWAEVTGDCWLTGSAVCETRIEVAVGLG